jgi:hypothetical protein
VEAVGYFLAWVALVFVCAMGYVLWRIQSARGAGDDPSMAGRRALSKAVRVAGAGVAGLVVAVGIAGVALMLAIFEWLGSGGREGGDYTTSSVLAITSVVVLVALPVGVAFAQRRRNR